MDLDGLSAILFSVHGMLAGITKSPELEFDEEESKRMALAYANVARHYNWAMSEKTMDWANFTMCIGAIYGSKFMAIKARKSTEPKKAKPVKEAPQPAPNIRPNPQSGQQNIPQPIPTHSPNPMMYTQLHEQPESGVMDHIAL